LKSYELFPAGMDVSYLIRSQSSLLILETVETCLELFFVGGNLDGIKFLDTYRCVVKEKKLKKRANNSDFWFDL